MILYYCFALVFHLFNTVFLLPSRAAHRVVYAFQKKTLMYIVCTCT